MVTKKILVSAGLLVSLAAYAGEKGERGNIEKLRPEGSMVSQRVQEKTSSWKSCFGSRAAVEEGSSFIPGSSPSPSPTSRSKEENRELSQSRISSRSGDLAIIAAIRNRTPLNDLKSSKFPVDIQPGDSKSPLVAAVQARRGDVVRWLLFEKNINPATPITVRRGDDIYQVEQGVEALSYAVKDGMVGMVDALIEAGVDKNAPDSTGTSAVQKVLPRAGRLPQEDDDIVFKRSRNRSFLATIGALGDIENLLGR